ALKHQRDVRLPYVLNYIRRREIMLQQFGLEGVEQERRAKDDLFGIQNSRKALTGMLQGLQDPRLMKVKQRQEEALLAAVAKNPKLADAADAWEQIAKLQKRRAALQGKGVSLNTRLFRIAQTLVQMAAEDQKPNAERLPEFRDSARDSLLQQLFSPAPIYKDLEQATLADLISWMIEQRGGDDPLVQQILAGKGPRDRAAELVTGTQLDRVEFRKKLAEGGAEAIANCKDPLIQLAQAVDAEARAVRKERDEISELERQAYGKIAEVLFAVKGTSSYPDATFTLRLAFGPVKGYVEDGRTIPPWTTMGGAFEHEKRHGAKEPWKLPESWVKARDRIDLDTPFNFVCTADIIGGNSGSPVINRDAELVGLIFDGNIQSLTADYLYDDKVSRAVSVDARALREALEKIYHADRIVSELGK
ncbi:MAG TPA: S46 family peptidase, partial [Planctomycetaceae bacterium]|nr:S46 family peptidase [Planctomycetaceae bacterium]